jgi:COP9 signalosome complex subunit 2
LKYEDPAGAIKEYNEIIQLSEDNPDAIEWCFKSYKQIMKINFNLKNYSEVLSHLDGALLVSNRISNKNYIEDSLTKIINNYSINSNDTFIESLYDKILKYADLNSYDRLWLKININKARLLTDIQEWEALIKAINDKIEYASQSFKDSFALELISIKIEFHTTHFDLNKLSELYRESCLINSAVTHPKILGIIKECGAKIQFFRGNYEKARLSFYECFKSFDEAGSPLKKKVLKYLVLCSILTENEFNPFESQETQAYTQLPEFKNLIKLINTYNNDDLGQLNRVIDQMKLENDVLVNDDIFIQSLSTIKVNLKAKSIVNYLKAYKSLPFEFLQRKFSISQDELESLLLKLINQGKLTDIKLDFVRSLIISTHQGDELKTSDMLPQEIIGNIKSVDYVGGKLTNISAPVEMEVDAFTSNYRKTSTVNENEEIKEVLPRLDDNSCFHKLLYLTEMPTKVALNEKITELQGFLASGIPKPKRYELSQKDQIFSMQRADQEVNNKHIAENDEQTNNNTTNTHTNLITQSADLQFDEETSDPVNKIDIINDWSKELQIKLNELIDTR